MAEEKKLETEPHLMKVFEEIIESNTAGSPIREEVRWTNLTPMEIVRLGIAKEVEARDEQFVRISQLKADYSQEGLPMLSIDTKKKEFLGQFYRKGKAYCEKAIEVNDHDFPSLAEGVVVPHGIYDVIDNKGYLSLGKSKDTSEFLCDNLKHF